MKYFLSLVAFISVIKLQSQNQVIISGQVKDAQTRQNLEFCNVAVYSPKDSLIIGAITDAKGFYKIPIQPGKYKIVVSFVGYKSDTLKSINANKDVFAGVHKLEPSAQELSAITVKTSSRESKIDKDVQIVTDEMKKNTSTAKEVLDKLNGVSLDRYNNKIKVDNSDKVIILVDGLEKDQEYVKNLAPDRLKKIEVIRDPSGKYGIEGYTAVINIILKKDYQGIEFFFNNNTMPDLDAEDSKYFFPMISGSLSLNYVYNNLNLYTRYGNWYNNFWVNSKVIKEYKDGTLTEQLAPQGMQRNARMSNFGNYGTLGCDFSINPKNTISYEGSTNFQPFNANRQSGIYHISNYLGNNLTFDYLLENTSKTSSFSHRHTLYYVGKYSENDELTTSFTFSTNEGETENRFIKGALPEVISKNKNNNSSYSYYLNYNHTFENSSSYQLGATNSYVEQKNNTINEGLENHFSSVDFRNRIFAYYYYPFSKKFSVKAGGIAELSNPKYNNQTRQFFSLQPYADMKIAPFSFIDFKAKYRTRYDYPSVTQLAPATIIIDNSTVRTGNPALSPAITHRLSLQTNIYEGFIRIEPFYHFSNNLVSEVGKLRPDNIFEYTYENSGRYVNAGWEFGIAFPLAKTIVMQNSFEFYRSEMETSGRKNRVNDWTMESQLLYYNEKSGTVGGIIFQRNQNREINALGWEKEDVNFWMLFMQQQFFKQRLSVMVGYFLPIDWAVGDYTQGGLAETNEYREEKKLDVSILKNFIMFEINYRFNKGRTVTRTQKNIENDNSNTKKGLF